MLLDVAEVGLQTFVDLLEFVGSLILSEGEGIHLGLDIFGLSLLQAALNTGAQALARCASLPGMWSRCSPLAAHCAELRCCHWCCWSLSEQYKKMYCAAWLATQDTYSAAWVHTTMP